ncbi:MAG: DMT family transporter [Xanthobacteraceae bacterium]|nr:MAG: DMT family transporter [Xanthobacteraceae bacterium]
MPPSPSQPAPPNARGPLAWLNRQPYLLLSLTALFWAGNIVVGRHAAGHVPPIALAFLRWAGAIGILLPFAWPHLVRERALIRQHLGTLILLSASGIAVYQVISYGALAYTQAINGLLIQSSGPLFIALWALVLFGARLTLAQAFGIALSLTGVLVIVLRGDLATVRTLTLNPGDVWFLIGMIVFGFYSALRRPPLHLMSVLTVTAALGALMLLPLFIWDIANGARLHADLSTVATLVYVATMPSALAYLFFNRGVELIGPNRAAPFFHLQPVFGSVLAMIFLNETLQLFHLIGYVLVLAGIAIAARSRAH